MTEALDPTWDLDTIFPGGSQSAELAIFIQGLETDIAALHRQFSETPVPKAAGEVLEWSRLITHSQELAQGLRQAGAFIACLTAQNVDDEQARLLEGTVRQLGAGFAATMTLLDAQILQMSDTVWSALLALPQLAPVTFPLAERRARAAEKLPPEQEALVSALAVDGYHAWGSVYNSAVGRMKIPLILNDQTEWLSVGQAENKLREADRGVRQAMFSAWETAWRKEAPLFASTLNHLAGFRLNLYRQRRWDAVLKEPLDLNRMTADTLDAMWAAIARGKPRLVAYMNRKSALMGAPGLTWHDVHAPVARAESGGRLTYDQGAQFIIEHFHRFSPRLANFAQASFEERWIEAENRPGKRPGGFCTSFPLSRQSRIFMTFDGHMDNVATLAHELGHAFHQHVMNDLPPLAQGYAMNVAETASTFAEQIVTDAALTQAAAGSERQALLAEQAERAISFFMNIHARFLFETRFYEERRRGPVGVGRLNALMEAAQREAYCDALTEYHPHFWAAKLHFHITGVPFYNFPYTFGFLFSAGIYARAQSEGPTFEQKYVDLLRDTGRMTVEDLAQKHLDVDLTQPDFWNAAVNHALQAADGFLQETAAP